MVCILNHFAEARNCVYFVAEARSGVYFEAFCIILKPYPYISNIIKHLWYYYRLGAVHVL